MSAARQEAIELRKRIDRGNDPAGQKRERRDAATIADLIDRYTRDHLPTMSQDPKRIADEKKKLEMIRTALVSTTKVADIHSGDIQEMHRRITETRGPVRANRVLVGCQQNVFNVAGVIGWRGFCLGAMLCKAIHARASNATARKAANGFSIQTELERIAKRLQNIRQSHAAKNRESDARQRIACGWSCCQGADHKRRCGLNGQSFTNPGFGRSHLRTPSRRRNIEFPLAPPAIELVERLRKDRAKSATWLFPGQTPGEPVTTLDHLWTFVIADAQLAPDEQGRAARVYDLRHSFASVGAGAGLGLPIIGKLLGHNNARTTAEICASSPTIR